MNQLDHIVVAADSLEQGAEYIRDTLGVEIPRGGVHKTMATHNCLMQLGNQRYLELIAIDAQGEVPAQPRWFGLDQALMRSSLKQQPRLITWVINTRDIQQLVKRAGFEVGTPTALSRDQLSWEFVLSDDGRLLAEGLLPYCIQWHSEPHPSAQMADTGCRLESLTIHHNRAHWISAMLDSIGASHLVEVEAIPDAESPWLSALISTPAGKRISLSSRGLD